jgi:hypothetical protein
MDIQKIKALHKKSNEWLSNYNNFGLSNDPVSAKEINKIKSILVKTEKLIKAASENSLTAKEIGSIPQSQKSKQEKENLTKSLQIKKKAQQNIQKEVKIKNQVPQVENLLELWKDLALEWIDSGIEEILKAKGKLDKGFLKTAEDFIIKANKFLELATLVSDSELKDKIEKVKTWIVNAQKVINLVNSLDKYLNQWKELVVAWMDSGISTIVNGVEIAGSITVGLVSKANEIKKALQKFIQEAKKVGDVNLDEKVKKAENWLKSADLILEKAGNLLDNLIKDTDRNSLPDWYDLLSTEWEKLKIKDLIPGNIDEKIIQSLDNFKSKVDEWLKKAVAEISPAIKQKIETAKLWLNDIKILIDLTQKGKEFVDALKNNDFNAVYEKLKKLWSELDNTESLLASTDLDDKLLEKIKELKAKAESFAALANSLIKKLPGGDQLGDIESWLKKAMEIASELAKGEDVIGNYLQLAKQWTEGEIKKIIDGTKELTAEVAGHVSGFINDVKKFLSSASTMKNKSLADKILTASEWIEKSESFLDKASEIIGIAIEDKNANNLPDWYEKLAAAWDKIASQDLLPGTDIDDAIIGKINVFKSEAEKWLKKAMEKGKELQAKIEIVKQWLETGNKFLKEVAGFVEDIKDGDLLSIYEKLKEGWAAIGNTDDILNGTTIDNKILDKAKDLKKQAESWLANVLTGGSAGGQMTNDVKNILDLADNFLTLIFTKYKVENHMQDFQEDKIVVNYPDARQLNTKEIEDLLGEYSGGMDGSVRNKLIAVLNRINQEILLLGNEMDAAYRKTLAEGGNAANVFVLSKKDYESVMKKQKQVEKMLDSLRKVLVGVITAALIPVNPVAAAAVGTLLSGTLDGFSDLAGFLGKTAGNAGGTVGTIGNIVSAILPGGEGTSIMSNADNAGLLELSTVFNNGVTAKFEEIKSKVNLLHKELDNIYKSLYKLDEKGIDKSKDAIATSADKWKRLNNQILDKYVRAKATRINEKAGYWLISRAQYAGWLVNKKDTMIVDEVIDALTNFNILSEAAVTWDKGAGGDIAKSLGWLLGGWASFGYDKKVKSLRNWASKEVNRLQNPAVWQSAFG